MKNQKFFFNVVAVLFVVGVFVLFVVGFKSLVFTKVGTVNLIAKQQLAVGNNRAVPSKAIGTVMRDLVTNQVAKITLNDIHVINAKISVGAVSKIRSNVSRVDESVKDVEMIDNNRGQVVI